MVNSFFLPEIWDSWRGSWDVASVVCIRTEGSLDDVGQVDTPPSSRSRSPPNLKIKNKSVCQNNQTFFHFGLPINVGILSPYHKCHLRKILLPCPLKKLKIFTNVGYSWVSILNELVCKNISKINNPSKLTKIFSNEFVQLEIFLLITQPLS